MEEKKSFEEATSWLLNTHCFHNCPTGNESRESYLVFTLG